MNDICDQTKIDLITLYQTMLIVALLSIGYFAAYTNLYNNSKSFCTKVKAWVYYAKFYWFHFKWSICHVKASIFLVLPSLYNRIKRNKILAI